MTPLRVTLDTNCVINLFDRTSQTATSFDELAALIRYGLSGKIEIAITTRVEADLANDKDPDRRGEMVRWLSVFPVMGTVARFDVSRFDNGDMLVGPEQLALHAEVQRIVFPGLAQTDRRYRNKLFDIDHLVGHKLNGKDIFVTDDVDIWRRRTELEAGPGIVVKKPSECLAYIDAIEERARPRTFPSLGLNPEYHSAALQGHVKFDYSNNNHRYAIGEGQFLFETRWSSASTEAIYAYTDSESIEALALVKSVENIRDIRDGTIFDFSSRVRSPNIGQIVIWRNVNGLYAATKILGIKCDDRNADYDELEFEYLILIDGSADFGKNP